MIKEGTLTDNGNTGEVDVSGAFTIHLSGIFGGGDFQLEFKDGSGTWRKINTTLYTFTDIADVRVDWKENTTFRGVLTGATAPSLFWKFGV